MSRRDFDPVYIEREFEVLESKLKRRVTIHAIGGFVMATKGLKPGTRDIDVILEDRNQFAALTEGLGLLGYRLVNKPVMEKVYRRLAAQAVLDNKDGFRWDVFMRVVANKLTLSSAMKGRSEPHIERGKLRVRMLSYEDIFLLKGVTDRERDLEDMFRIVRSGIDYDTVYRECLRQSELTGRIWETALSDACEELKDRYKLAVPFLPRLRRMAEQKVFSQMVKREVMAGHDSEESIAISLSSHFSSKAVRGILTDLGKKGEIEIRSGKITIPKKSKPRPSVW